MATEFPPFVNSTGQLNTLFNKIKEAPAPPRFTQDFLTVKLGFSKSGSTLPFIPFLKRIGFIGSDGVPTNIYKKFRNPDATIAGLAMAKAIKIGYQDLYSRNEYWHTMSKENLKNFLIETTETDAKNKTINIIINTIEVLKSYANFEEAEKRIQREIDSGITLRSEEPIDFTTFGN